ncbi:SDR family oxidoreductase [Corynebacterium pseudodiphtheriticum]|uniref:SDR family NAD(P)-dependent oxidoreductase n=1 Tax=Corynebacterium pseudodiphtheriticum TaxID=37637 RepID=UPI00254DCD97|nr:SDR family NAD(P)-dependent oxidoreductase [Corynebacterium pseudodiphtheriticum]MDK8478379.1 SDR family oxidoreductase [Corynebacterium pseudodiphtheriticum]MDK8614853.1 SDR family oxidoreductase [Corynebacterium pseudodiphtheriticum]MDK8738792.1 SDR family oxidoreductase [Corynebacterium pseudodiphtheriticum]MDK8745334.1 SDR family oxidoreductase [Corynebacterium pseudodiphtheriticum]MDK8761972.1 SDR family oxidoreductase [Corynebacterium pseudodiphtheriticum]
MHAVITGATGGIGRACATLFRSQNYAVSSWDLPEVDVTDPAALNRALTTAVNAHGPVNCLVHCAGVLHPDTPLNSSATIREHLEVNVIGLVNTANAVARHMLEQSAGFRRQANLVIVSSNAAAVPRLTMASYAASKAAATSFAKSLALELAPHHIRCNIVSPGSTDTAMLRSMWSENSSPDDNFSAIIAGSPEQFRLGIPLQKVATDKEIAQACYFLSSPAASHITMHDLRIDGGATLDC